MISPGPMVSEQVQPTLTVTIRSAEPVRLRLLNLTADLFGVVVDLLDGGSDIPHIGSTSQQHALCEPDRLLIADDVVLRALVPLIVAVDIEQLRRIHGAEVLRIERTLQEGHLVQRNVSL